MAPKNTPVDSSAGGRARASALTASERSSIASKAAAARWGGRKATHVGELTIGSLVLPCAVLDTGQRVVSYTGFQRVIGTGNPGRKEEQGDVSSLLPAKNLQAFISEELREKLRNPIVYRAGAEGKGGNVLGYTGHGLEARLLPEICDVYLKARDAGVLHYKQEALAHNADILMRGMAVVGIVALVDEATGYQAERARDELNRILAAYVAEEFRQWVPAFPDDFFREIYRLRGWEYRPGNTKGPRYIGKLINRYIYEQLPSGVLDRLRELNPVTETGRRRHRHRQFLTDHTGDPHLDKQITVVTTLMRVSRDNHEFESLFRKAFPRVGEQQLLRISEHAEDVDAGEDSTSPALDEGDS
ncbi:MAG: P63C domain-containing protein [Polyangiales bacterium]